MLIKIVYNHFLLQLAIHIIREIKVASIFQSLPNSNTQTDTFLPDISFPVLLPIDLAKKRFLENIAKPSQGELIFFRFTKSEVANRQIKQGKFNQHDLEFYQGRRVAPGQREYRRMGKGVYAISYDRLGDLGSFGEDRILRNNPSPIKITLPKGSLVLDLTDPEVHRRLREADISDHDIAFIDPRAAIKFRENPGSKIFYILKDLEQAKISPANKSDFARIDSAELQTMCSKMSGKIQASIKHLLPDDFKPPKPKHSDRFVFQLLLTERTFLRVSYSLAFHLKGLQADLRLKRNVALLNPDKLFPSPAKDDFFSGNSPNAIADSLYHRGRCSIIKITHRGEIEELLKDPRFRVRVFSEEILSTKSVIRKCGGVKKGDTFALITPMPLRRKIPNENWPLKQHPIDPKTATQAFEKYFSQPYQDQNQTICRFFGDKKEVVARPNHSVLNGIRGGLLSIDSALLILKHAPDTELGQWIAKKVDQDPYFLEKLFFGGTFMVAARRGEDKETDVSALKLRCAALIWNEAKRDFSRLFRDEAERASFARAFAYNYKTNQISVPKAKSQTIDAKIKSELEQMGIAPNTELSIEEKFYATLFHLGHYNDHRRMFAWSRTKSFLVQDRFLKMAGRIENSELRKRIIITLWTRSGYYLQTTSAGDCDLFAKLGLSNWRKQFGSIKNRGPILWYRDIRHEDLFFKFSNHPDEALQELTQQQASLDDELLPASFQDDLSYLF